MNPKFEAVKRTLFMLMVSTIAASAVIALFTFLTTEQLVITVTVAVIAWLFYIFYSINLGVIESEMKLKKMMEKE